MPGGGPGLLPLARAAFLSPHCREHLRLEPIDFSAINGAIAQHVFKSPCHLHHPLSSTLPDGATKPSVGRTPRRPPLDRADVAGFESHLVHSLSDPAPVIGRGVHVDLGCLGRGLAQAVLQLCQ